MRPLIYCNHPVIGRVQYNDRDRILYVRLNNKTEYAFEAVTMAVVDEFALLPIGDSAAFFERLCKWHRHSVVSRKAQQSFDDDLDAVFS